MPSSSSHPPHTLISPKRPLLPPKAPATHTSYTVPLPSRAELQPPPTKTTTITTTTPPLTFHAAHPPQPFLDPSLLPKRRAEAQAAQERLARSGAGS